MTGKKILMLIGEYSEEYEIFVFEQGMEAVGHSVDARGRDPELTMDLSSVEPCPVRLICHGLLKLP